MATTRAKGRASAALAFMFISVTADSIINEKSPSLLSAAEVTAATGFLVAAFARKNKANSDTLANISFAASLVSTSISFSHILGERTPPKDKNIEPTTMIAENPRPQKEALDIGPLFVPQAT